MKALIYNVLLSGHLKGLAIDWIITALFFHWLFRRNDD